MLVAWDIWRERNKKVFRNREIDMPQLLAKKKRGDQVVVYLRGKKNITRISA